MSGVRVEGRGNKAGGSTSVGGPQRVKRLSESIFMRDLVGLIHNLGHYPCMPGSNILLKGHSEGTMEKGSK